MQANQAFNEFMNIVNSVPKIDYRKRIEAISYILYSGGFAGLSIYSILLSWKAIKIVCTEKPIYEHSQVLTF